MEIQNISPVLPVDDLAASVEAWAALLGVRPRFVDGERWAQFEAGGCRLALAGADRDAGTAGVMVKVDDLAAARERATKLGLTIGPDRQGPHETRFTLTAPGGWPVTFYAPRP
ncbi:MAG: VOC family protein [Caulobacteraceae bacterium]